MYTKFLVLLISIFSLQANAQTVMPLTDDQIEVLTLSEIWPLINAESLHRESGEKGVGRLIFNVTGGLYSKRIKSATVRLFHNDAEITNYKAGVIAVMPVATDVEVSEQISIPLNSNVVTDIEVLFHTSHFHAFKVNLSLDAL